MLNRVYPFGSRPRVLRAPIWNTIVRQERYSHERFPRYPGHGSGSAPPTSYSYERYRRGGSFHGESGLEHEGFERRRKWVKWSAVTGTVMATTMGIIWVAFNKHVPIAETKQFNFIPRKWMVHREAKWNFAISALEKIVGDDAAPKPGLLWPDDHPTTLVVRKVFNRLLRGSGYDPALWHIDIVDCNTSARCDVAMNGKAIIYSGTLSLARDEAGLALILSDALMLAISSSTSIEVSHVIFQWTAAIPAAQLLVTSFFMRRLFFLAIPYTYMYAKYLGRYRGDAGFERDFLERTYALIMMVQRAGYDLEDAMGSAMRNLFASEAALEEAEGGGMVEVVNEEVDEDAEDGMYEKHLNMVRQSNRLDKLRVMNMIAWIPEVREKVGDQKMAKQESRPLPETLYTSRSEFQPVVEL